MLLRTPRLRVDDAGVREPDLEAGQVAGELRAGHDQHASAERRATAR